MKPPILPLSSTMFTGDSSEAYNAVRSALTTAAHNAGHTGDYCEYEWLQDLPRASLCVELVHALRCHGYEVRKISSAVSCVLDPKVLSTPIVPSLAPDVPDDPAEPAELSDPVS